MAAVSYTYKTGNDIFLNGISFSSPIATAFDSIGSSLGLITSVAVQTSESVQYFLTFDDVINFLHFGKGVGSIAVQGVSFPDCGYNFPAVKDFFSVAGASRGKVMTVSISGAGAFSGPLISASCNVAAGEETLIEFSASMAMTDHTLSGGSPSAASC